MKKIRNIILGLLAAGMLTVAVPVGGFSAYASSAKISFSDPSATVGQEFSVNVKITSQDGNLGSSDVVLSYDPSVIEFVSGNNASGGAGSVRLVGTVDSTSTKAFSYALKFKAVQAGNTTITVSSSEVYDADAKAVTVSKQGTSSIKVKAQSTSSTEAALSSLKISPGTLSPTFSPDVTSYTTQVGSGVDKLAVSATAKDGKAKVLVSGDSGLKIGSNTVVCKVTAEDGQTTKSYTITVNKLDTPDVPSDAETEAADDANAGIGVTSSDGLDVEIDGVNYTVATEFDVSLLPEGYTQSTCSYGEFEVQCGTGNDLTLLYLQGTDGNGAFYIYVPESGVLSPYVSIDVTARSILVLPPDETVQIPEGFIETTIQLNGTYKVQGWVWKSDTEQQYCVVYGMNANGEKSLYRYDIAEKTFQRYFEDPSLATKYDDAQVEEIIDKYNELCNDYNIRFIVIAALGVLCMILFFIVLNLLLRRKPSKEEPRDKDERRNKRRSSDKYVDEDVNTERVVRRKSSDADERRGEHQVRRNSSDEECDERPVRRPSSVKERDERPVRKRPSDEANTDRPVRKRPSDEANTDRPVRRRPSDEANTDLPVKRRPSDEESTDRSVRKRTSTDDRRTERTVRRKKSDEEYETNRVSSENRRTERPVRKIYDEEYPEHPVRRTSDESLSERRTSRSSDDRYEKSSARTSSERSCTDRERRKKTENARPSVQVRPATRTELYYTLEREDFVERPTRYESETERSRRAREAKARLEQDLRDDDDFEYIDDPR